MYFGISMACLVKIYNKDLVCQVYFSKYFGTMENKVTIKEQ